MILSVAQNCKHRIYTRVSIAKIEKRKMFSANAIHAQAINWQPKHKRQNDSMCCVDLIVVCLQRTLLFSFAFVICFPSLCLQSADRHHIRTRSSCSNHHENRPYHTIVGLNWILFIHYCYSYCCCCFTSWNFYSFIKFWWCVNWLEQV